MNIESKLEDIEIAIENMNETIEESSKYLKLISRELIVSNQVHQLREKQRKMFELCDDLDLQQRMLKYYKERLSEAKDDVASDGYRFDIEKKTKKIDELYEEIGLLSNDGCIVV